MLPYTPCSMYVYNISATFETDTHSISPTQPVVPAALEHIAVSAVARAPDEVVGLLLGAT